MTGPLEGLPAPAARPVPSARPRRRAGTSLVVGALLVGLVAATALLSLLWTPHDPLRIDAAARLLGPSAEHPLGTDRFGRDTLSLLMLGARTTLLVGSLSVGLAALVGVPLGLLAATAGGWVDSLLMRANDLLLAFPALLLAIMLAAVFGGGTVTATAAIAVATVPAFARVTRAGALRVLRTDYVLAARAAGRSRPDIAVRHVLPNVGRHAGRPGVGVLRHRRAGRGGAELPRLRDAAAHPVLGPHAAGVAGVRLRDPAAGAGPGAGDRRCGARLQPARRRPA
jgi:ABC-type dipeptide/oligopeptide/nickel transport system permease subunit